MTTGYNNNIICNESLLWIFLKNAVATRRENLRVGFLMESALSYFPTPMTVKPPPSVLNGGN